MNKYISLLKVFLKSTGEVSYKSKKRLAFLIIFLLIVMIPLISELIDFVSTGYDVLSLVNQEGIIISIGLAIVSLIIFFFGLFSILNSFYFSENIENILYLPLKQSEILGAKFTLVVIYQYILQGIFILPLIIIYGIKANVNLVYYLYSIIIFFINPVVPLCIASILVMIVMRFSKLSKNKDKFKILSSIIIFAIVFPLNMYIQNITKKGYSIEKIQQLAIEGNNSYINIISNIFPSSKFATLSLINSSNIKGLINFILFILINLLFAVLFIWLGEKLYFKGVIGISQTSSKRKKLSKKEINQMSLKKSVLRAYISKELKLIFRTPSYFLSGILMELIFPIIFLASIFFQGNIKNIIPNSPYEFYSDVALSVIFTVFLGIFLFISSINPLAATAISREGKGFYFNKYIPIKCFTVIIAKIIAIFIIHFAIVLIWGIPIFFIFKVPILAIIAILIIAAISMFFSTSLGVLIDLYFPKFNWYSEQEAIKKNFNIYINLLINIIIGAFIIFSLFTLQLSSSQSIFTYIFIILFILNILICMILKIKCEKRFENII